jgi:chromosome segregation ATPase
MVALLEKAEYKEKQLTNALSKLTQDHNSLLVRTASEHKSQEDSNFDLKSSVSRLERQVGDLSSRLEQAFTQQSTLASKLQTSETTNSRLNAELTQVNSALASTKLKLHSAEDAQASLQRQIKEITETHARVLVDSSQLPRLDAQIRGMEATQTQQVAFNLQLQEDVRRLQRENEALKRAKAEDLKAAKDQVSHQAAKFAAQIDSLEAQLQRHLDSDQENRGRLVASMLDSKSSLLLKTHRTKR